jgi:hypothetical protein
MEYALGLDLGGAPGTVAISGPESSQGADAEVLADLAPGDRVDRLLDSLGDPRGATSGRDAAADELAALVPAALRAATAVQGIPPTSVVVAHPSSWGPYRVALLRSALTDHPAPVELVPAAVAALAHASASGVTRPGDVVAVLDLRDEHLEISVVSASGAGAGGTTVGVPRVLTDLGALDVDDAVLAHVRSVLDDGGIEVVRADAARLRAACARAATELVTSAATTVTWQADAGGHEVRVVASEVDARLRPRAARAVAAAAEAVAGDARTGVDRVLLVGRVAALPLLTELLAERFEAPLTVLAGDSHAVARGAAVLARAVEQRPAPTSGPVAGTRAARGRRAHVRDAPRRPARVAALLGTGVIALGVAALAVSGAALASPGAADDGRAGAVFPGTVSVLEDRHDADGMGTSGAATVLGPPSLTTGSVLGSLPGPASDVLAHPHTATGRQQASSG